MQTLFDLPMSSSFTYIIAIIVILLLLALFAFIVRRVAGQGLNPEGGRGRGPRLGVVDTYSLDRTRQLVIVRRDDVEHLLMIGGTTDILIESNIVRAIGAAAIREQQQSYSAQQVGYDAPSGRPLDDDEPFSVPQSAPVQSQAQAAPRLKVAPSSSAQIAAQAYAQRPAPVAEQQQVELSNAALAQAREALNTAELQALAKRLEASIPPASAKVERPTQSSAAPAAPAVPAMPQVQNPQIFVQPEAKPQPAPQMMPQAAAPAMPQTSQPMAPPPAYVAPIPQPVAPIPQPASPVIEPPVAPPPMPPMQQPQQVQMKPQPAQPIMPQPRPPMKAPVMPQASAPVMPQQQPLPPRAQEPMAPPQAPAPQPMPEAQPEPVKDRQANALDENLRRLLGRKLDQR